MGVTLYQIRALTSFGDVREGDLGGFIESYDNLENDLEKGTAWIDKESKAFNKAIVRDYAKVESSNIFDNAVVDGYARLKECEVSGNAVIKGNAEALDKAFITDTSIVEGSAWIVDKATVEGYSHIKNSAIIAANAIISDSIVSDYVCIGAYVKVRHDSKISGRVEISGSTLIDKSEISDTVRVSGINDVLATNCVRIEESNITGNLIITKGANISDASIKNSSDLIIFDANVSKNGAKSTFKTFTAYINRKGHQRIDSYKNETRSLTALKYDAKKNPALGLLVSKIERLFN